MTNRRPPVHPLNTDPFGASSPLIPKKKENETRENGTYCHLCNRTFLVNEIVCIAPPTKDTKPTDLIKYAHLVCPQEKKK